MSFNDGADYNYSLYQLMWISSTTDYRYVWRLVQYTLATISRLPTPVVK